MLAGKECMPWGCKTCCHIFRRLLPLLSTRRSPSSLSPTLVFRARHRRSSHVDFSFTLRNKILSSECINRFLQERNNGQKKKTRRRRRRKREMKKKEILFLPFLALHFLAHFLAVLQICCQQVFMTDDYTPRSQ